MQAVTVPFLHFAEATDDESDLDAATSPQRQSVMSALVQSIVSKLVDDSLDPAKAAILRASLVVKPAHRPTYASTESFPTAKLLKCIRDFASAEHMIQTVTALVRVLGSQATALFTKCHLGMPCLRLGSGTGVGSGGGAGVEADTFQRLGEYFHHRCACACVCVCVCNTCGYAVPSVRMSLKCAVHTCWSFC